VQIGFNFTLTDTVGTVRRLIADKHIAFCELLIDNFLHVPPHEFATAFDCPIAFHIMHSRFLESDPAFLVDLASRLRPYIDALDPIYISDHVARFSHRGRELFHLGEIDYRSDYAHVCERVSLWQKLLGRRIHLENYPSIMDGAFDAAEFFTKLGKDTGSGVLFDVSNAVCAHRNSGVSLELWDPVIAGVSHFHVAGYSLSVSKPEITLDTHDTMLAADTFDFLATISAAFDTSDRTLIYECDADLPYHSIVEDLARLHAIFGTSRAEKPSDSLMSCHGPA
jgi:methanobactin biosynthesis cassette protein MbnB